MKGSPACCAAVVLALIFPCAARAGDWHLSVEPLFGMRYGETDEYVFLKECSYASDKLSELNWEYKPVWYAGARVNGGWKSLKVSASATVSFPGKTGSMYDSDWLNSQEPGLEDFQYKTNYTESDCYLTSAWSWGVNGGYAFTPLPFLSITPFTAFDYEYIAFEGKGLSGWYGNSINNALAAYTDTENRTYKYIDYDTTTIDYKRETYIVWLGTEFSFTPHERLSFLLPAHLTFTIGEQIAPFIYTVSIDRHYQNSTRGTEYADVCYGYFSAAKLYSSLALELSSKLSVSLYGSWFFYFNPLRGNNFSKTIGDDFYSKQSNVNGGASAWTAEAGLSVKYSFF
ncbi:MAG: omptin family outer membrane protease [Treponema sp.]|nr:omptin family outer membrane protease [Treponema sp.]